MDDRRFDSLTRSLASGASRRSMLKGLLGLGGVALVGSAALEGDAEAAKRPTPTPTPIKCPGRQTPVNGVCTCPGNAPNRCGADCCTGKSTDSYPRAAGHSECCDSACCFGTCYGEELCCPTNDRPGGLPSTHQVCNSANGVECCTADQPCCEVDGCCDTVCWGGQDDNSNCCSEGAYCPGNDSPDLCCTNNFICCGTGTRGNLCRDPNVANGCCTDSDCANGQICDDNLCVAPCAPATVHVFAQTHGAVQSPDTCPGPFQPVVTEIGLYSFTNGACSPTPIATASTEESAPAIFNNVPAGQYCALPTDGSLIGCLDCPNFGSGVGENLTVPCGETVQFNLGFASCCVNGVTVPVFVHAPTNECSQGTELAGISAALYDCASDELLYGPVLSNSDGYADFLAVMPGTYCVHTTDDSGYRGCERCVARSQFTVTCPNAPYPILSICSDSETCVDGFCAPEDPCGGECAPSEVCVQDECLCAPGYYSEEGACAACPAGTYSDVPGSISCDSCDLNFYQPDPAATTCLPCVEGFYTEHVRSTMCIECNCALGNMPLICDCGPTPCEPGYAPDGAGTCELCPVGSASFDGAACVPCVAGHFASSTGTVACSPCAVGSYADGIGAVVCVQCPTGSFAGATGSTACQDCELNSYQPNAGASSCLECPGDTYTEHVGATACIDCNCQNAPMPPICECGEIPCQPGSELNQQQVCTPCPAGAYSPVGLQCDPCEPGSISANTGSVACTLCPEGTYAPSFLGTMCLECNAGSYASFAGSTECAACPVGTYADASSAAICTPCAAGTFASHTGQTSCAACDCGEFCDPTTGTCTLTPTGGACSVDSNCASGHCGCGAPPGFPPCFCRTEDCLADLSNCTGSIGAAACCQGDCLGNDTDGYLCVGPR